jgi:hypothetical protein
MLTAIGNTCLALALLLLLFPTLPATLEPVRGGNSAGGAPMFYAIVLLPIWALLTVAMCLVTARNGLDWFIDDRPKQYAAVLVSSLAMLVVCWFSGSFRGEPHTPYAARPFITWAVFALPLTVMAYAFLKLNPTIGTVIPNTVTRMPTAVAATLCLAACMGLLVELFISIQMRHGQEIDTIVADQKKRDAWILKQVQDADPEKDLGSILNQTSRFENDEIRNLALTKVRSHPRFRQELAAMLRNEWYDEALIFLESNEIEDPQEFAEPAREAFVQTAAFVRKAMREYHHVRDDDFDSRAIRVLAVASKFKRYGVDYSPAIQAFRDALEEPRQQRPNLNARRILARGV